MSSELPGRSRSIWNHQSRPVLWFQDPVHVSLSQGKTEPETLLMGVIGVVGVVGDVPIMERPLRLPQPNLDVVDAGELISSGGGGAGTSLPKQLTPTPAAYDSD